MSKKPRLQSLSQRKSKVRVEDFATALPKGASFAEWFDSLPPILGARQLKALVQAWHEAKCRRATLGVAMGAHVLKVGLQPLLIDLMEKGFITHIATNGAGAIHDYEFALVGHSSEDVAANLEDGSFGFWQETFDGLRAVVDRAKDRGKGFGETLGEEILEQKLPHADRSIFAAASRLGIPATVHVAIGCDIVHMDSELDGAAVGAASLFDFRRLCESVETLTGGLWINLGSAVLMPEVFLKAVSLARNRGKLGKDFTTANLDMLRQYRATENVIRRPPDKGIEILGQHEILLPLLHQALISLP